MIHTLEVSRTVTVTKIAFTARMRAGKDTAAHHLYIRHGFNKVAFGDALKRNAHAVFPWVSEFSKPRALYQQYGQLMREVESDVWIRHVERRVAAIIELENRHKDAIGIVLTDVRQANEIEWCRANGFSIVRVTAPDEVRIQRAIAAGDSFTEADLEHVTESAIDGFAVDYEISNDGTVAELQAKVDEVIAKIREAV